MILVTFLWQSGQKKEEEVEQQAKIEKSQLLRPGTLITENTAVVGFVLHDKRILRFQTPQQKLYTDPLAFFAASQAGIGGFLISEQEPNWGTACTQTFEQNILECQLSGSSVILFHTLVSDKSFWLATLETSRESRAEVIQYIQEITDSLRVTDQDSTYDTEPN